MKAAIDWSIYIWRLYWNDSCFQYLLPAAVLYLLIFHRKKRSVRQVLAFSALVLFVYLFPPTSKLICFCIGDNVYWRVLWLLPTIPVIALAATELLRGRRSRLARAALLLLCCGVIAISGRDMLSSGSYTRTVNRQKVPDPIAHICNRIQEEAQADGIREICMVSDEYVASYVRVYDPSITQAYGRWGRNAINRAARRVFHLMRQEEPNYRKIAKYARRAGCNFLVISVPKKKVRKIKRFGYVKIGDVGSYSIFQLEEN